MFSSERFSTYVSAARIRNQKQFRFALLVAIIIAVLLWQTQWLALRPGLSLLLLGQLAAAVAFFIRSQQLGSETMESNLQPALWFVSEQRFVQFSALCENLVRIAGFFLLAYGFWTSTHILWIALLLGVAYPVFSYFGVSRRNTQQVLRLLHQQSLEGA